MRVRATTTASAVAALALLVIGASIALVWILDTQASAGSPPGATIWLLSLTGAPVAGWIIASRRPGHRYGALLLSFGLTSGLLELCELATLFAIRVRGTAGGPGVVAAMTAQVLWPLVVAHMPVLLLLFPDGRVPSPRWRWVLRVVVWAAVVGALATLLVPGQLGEVALDNPLGLAGAAGAAAEGAAMVALGTVFIAIIPAAGSLFGRARHASPQERLQLRWFSWAAALFAVLLLVAIAVGMTSDVETTLLIAIGFAAMYTAIGVAITRHRLYDIDRLVSRTLAYAVLSALLVAVYLGNVTVLTAVTSPVTEDSPIAVAAATLLAAAAFQPLRRRVQSGVDRRFNRARYDAALAVAAYRARLRDELELEAITADLVTTVRGTVEPVGTAVWLRPAGGTS